MNDGFSLRICTVTGEHLPLMKNRVTMSSTRCMYVAYTLLVYTCSSRESSVILRVPLSAAESHVPHI